jgi:hypothetical protein
MIERRHRVRRRRQQPQRLEGEPRPSGATVEPQAVAGPTPSSLTECLTSTRHDTPKASWRNLDCSDSAEAFLRVVGSFSAVASLEKLLPRQKKATALTAAARLLFACNGSCRLRTTLFLIPAPLGPVVAGGKTHFF